jgi:hypothetical protein
MELMSDELEVEVRLWWTIGLVTCLREILPNCICPRPETISKGKTDRLYERLIQVGGKELLEAVDDDGGDDFEQERMGT